MQLERVTAELLRPEASRSVWKASMIDNGLPAIACNHGIYLPSSRVPARGSSEIPRVNLTTRALLLSPVLHSLTAYEVVACARDECVSSRALIMRSDPYWRR